MVIVAPTPRLGLVGVVLAWGLGISLTLAVVMMPDDDDDDDDDDEVDWWLGVEVEVAKTGALALITPTGTS